MESKEYLLAFSNEGNWVVKVKFSAKTSSIPDKKISLMEIFSLVDSVKENFLTEMEFDEHLLKIRKYEINPFKKIFTIYTE